MSKGVARDEDDEGQVHGKASSKVMSSHQAMSGIRYTISVNWKPTAWAMRLATLRPRLAWRLSHHSNRVLKIRFQIIAMVVIITANGPVWLAWVPER